MTDFLDKKIIAAGFEVYFSNCYDSQEMWEQVLDTLQDVRAVQKGERLDITQMINRVDILITRARIMRGELYRVGNMIIPNIETMKKWQGYVRVSI